MKSKCKPAAARSAARRQGTILLAGVAVLLSGCVYSRLLTLKRQLADFDRFVELRTENGIVFDLRQPVATGPDIVRVSGLTPSAVTSTPDGEQWSYVYQGLSPGESGEVTNGVEIVFLLDFVSNRLARIELPNANLTVFGREFFASAARAMGAARVSPRACTVQWNPADEAPPSAASTFTPEGLRPWLGPPLGGETNGPRPALRYAFLLRAPEGSREGPARTAANLFFSPDTGLLTGADFSGGRVRFVLDCGAGRPRDQGE